MIGFGILLILIVVLFLTKIKKDTIGFRNNNPFNIRDNYLYRSDYASSPGEKGFLKFLFLDDGLEAGYRLLLYYFKNRNSYPVKDFITRYAEGDKNYIKFLVSELGTNNIEKTKILDLGKLIVRFENGSAVESDRMGEAYKRALKR